MEVVVATHNSRKFEEIRAVFRDSTIELLTLDDAGVEGQPSEDGRSLDVNALKKAWYAHERCKLWTMADDTGLFIDALNGEPGVHTARWGGQGLSVEMRTGYCLGRMHGKANRSALFSTQVAIVMPDSEKRFFDGAVAGRLLETPRVRPEPPMPFGCLFVPEGHSKSLAEMTLEEENTVSHRGIAFRKARAFLEQHL